MKLKDLFEPKHLSISLAAGIGFMFASYALINTRSEEAAVRIVMWPGILLSELVGLGGHDLLGVLLYFLGNILFYWVLAFLLLLWLRIRYRGRGSHGCA
jgi:hypothetical protein